MKGVSNQTEINLRRIRRFESCLPYNTTKMAIKFFRWKCKHKRKKRSYYRFGVDTSWPGADKSIIRLINRAQRHSNRQ